MDPQIQHFGLSETQQLGRIASEYQYSLETAVSRVELTGRSHKALK